MPTGLRIDAPVLAGQFQEAIGNRLAGGLGSLAPIIYLPAKSGRYLAASEDGVISELENGFDPLVPVGLNSPAREIVQNYKEIDFKPKKFFEFMFENSVTAAMIAETMGNDVRNRQVARLSQLHADRIERYVSLFYGDPANYAAAATTIDLASGPSALIEAIEVAVAAVRPANNVSEEYVINVILGTQLITRLRRELAPLAGKDVTYLSGDSLEQLLSDQLSANVKVFSSASVYSKNRTSTTQNATRAQMWDPMFFAVTAVATDAVGLPSFAHMPAYDTAMFRGSASDGAVQEYLTARVGDEFSRIVEMYAVDDHNPRGARTYCESFFDVQGGDNKRGILFNVIDSGA